MCAKECWAFRSSQIPLPAFRLETVSAVTGQCWERRSAGHSAGAAHTLQALDEATALRDLDVCHMRSAQWDKFAILTCPCRCLRVETPVAWQMRWL
jgi:hypothetical protein